MANKFRSEISKKKNSFNWGIILISVFVAGIMITSILGYMWGGDENSSKYNEFTFRKTADGWTTQIKISKDSKPSTVRFDFAPFEVERINISEKIMTRLSNAPMFYMTYDALPANVTPTTEESYFMQSISFAQYEIQQNLWKEKKLYTLLGLMTENPDYALPQITCANATASTPVIEFRTGETTQIFEEGNCIIFQSESPTDFIAIKDRFLLGVFGVIE